MIISLCRRAAIVLGALVLSTLTACVSSTLSDVAANGLTDTPVFPTVHDVTTSSGTFVNLENLSKIQAGMTKQQIQALIGHPQFAEGMFAVREWDYLLHIYRQGGVGEAACQYKVLFDSQYKARSFHAQPAGCLDGLAQISQRPQSQSQH